jgi:hypothetical protein
MDQAENAASKRGRALVAGWVCFGVGIAFLAISLATLFIYAPLFLAAFILSIVAMAQGRIAAGIVLLLVTVIVPPVAWVGTFAANWRASQAAQTRNEVDVLAGLNLENVEGRIEDRYVYCKAIVRNSGTAGVSFVKVQVEWLDASGAVVDTGESYAVGAETLRPGGAKSFEIMTRRDARMKRYQYKIVAARPG